MGLRLCVTMSDSLLHSSLKTMFQKALSCISLCSTPRRFLGLSSQSTTGWGNLKRRKCNVSQFRTPEVPKEGVSRAALPLKATEDSLLALPSFECFSAVLGSWLCTSGLCLCRHLSSPCVHLSSWDTGHGGLGAHPWPFPLTNYICNDPVSS